VPTEKDLDLAVSGEGYFMIQMPDGSTAYTRDGSFNRDDTGQLVNVNGYPVQPGIVVPDNAQNLHISADGLVSAMLPGQTAPTQLGQLQLATFVNKAGLASLGDNHFTETAPSGTAHVGVPKAEGTRKHMKGYLEEANVNAVTEIADLIAAQRAYEMNARVISGADEMMQSTTQMR
jgi:flagellar basal-body rod protein FlgG